MHKQNIENQFLLNHGRNIKRIRKSQRISLDQLALLTGVSLSSLSLFENGKRDLRLSTFYRIVRALSCSDYDLLNERGFELEMGKDEEKSDGTGNKK